MTPVEAVAIEPPSSPQRSRPCLFSVCLTPHSGAVSLNFHASRARSPLHTPELCPSRPQAKMVDFGGWDMPVQYSGILDEHNAVRNAVGLFDVSHMGEIEIRGPEAAKLTDYVTTNAVAQAEDRPGALLRPALRARRLRRRHPGAQGRRRPLLPVRQRLQSGQGFRAHRARTTGSTPRWRTPATATRRSPSRVRRRCATLQKLTPVDLARSSYYWFTDGEVSGTPARIAHTGYTGEDGFEIYVAARRGRAHLERNAGRRRGIRHQALRPGRAQHAAPGSQDGALRPRDRRLHLRRWEADLGWIVKLDKGDFVGRDALVKQKESGVTRKLVGFEMRGRGIGRDGYEVFLDGVAGRLGHQRLALADAEQEHRTVLSARGARGSPARAIQIMIRNQPVDAVTVATPFYKRAK